MSGTCTSSGSGDLFDVDAAGDDLVDAVRLVAGDEVDPPLRAPVVVPARDEVRRLEVVTSRAMMSRSPRTAFTGVPSGALTESGTP